MAISLQPLVKTRLYEYLKDAEQLQGVQVTYGHPGKHMEKKFLMVGDIYGESVNAAVGRRRRDEEFTIVLVVSVVDAGDNQQLVTDRAYEVVNAAADAIDADPTLGSLPGLVYATPTGTVTLIEQMADEGRHAGVEFGIECKTRI